MFVRKWTSSCRKISIDLKFVAISPLTWILLKKRAKESFSAQRRKILPELPNPIGRWFHYGWPNFGVTQGLQKIRTVRYIKIPFESLCVFEYYSNSAIVSSPYLDYTLTTSTKFAILPAHRPHAPVRWATLPFQNLSRIVELFTREDSKTMKVAHQISRASIEEATWKISRFIPAAETYLGLS